MSATAQKKLLELANKHLEKFISLVPRVLVSDRPDIIHDTRVYSRRLQQVIRVFFPGTAAGKAHKLIRALRKTRRSLGGCRNLDVAMDLVQNRIDASRGTAIHDAWSSVWQYLAEKRNRKLSRGRRQIEQRDLVTFLRRARSLFASSDREKDPERLLKRSIETALADWSDALDTARQEPSHDAFHALRIAGKRLRYRLELLAAMNDETARTKIKAVKNLQDEIGQWRDRQVMVRYVANFAARPDFTAEDPNRAKVLLAELDAEQQRNDTAIAGILERAEKIRSGWATNVRRRPHKGVDRGSASRGSAP